MIWVNLLPLLAVVIMHCELVPFVDELDSSAGLGNADTGIPSSSTDS